MIKNSRPRPNGILALSLLGLALTGCGTKGPLTLPPGQGLTPAHTPIIPVVGVGIVPPGGAVPAAKPAARPDAPASATTPDGSTAPTPPSATGTSANTASPASQP